MWNWLLIKLGLRIDWTDPRNAPPFVPEVPHEYQEAFRDVYTSAGPGEDCQHVRAVPAGCCARCGGGSLHPIHHGKAVPYSGSRITDETTRLMTHAPGDEL